MLWNTVLHITALLKSLQCMCVFHYISALSCPIHLSPIPHLARGPSKSIPGIGPSKIVFRSSRGPPANFATDEIPTTPDDLHVMYSRLTALSASQSLTTPFHKTIFFLCACHQQLWYDQLNLTQDLCLCINIYRILYHSISGLVLLGN